METNKAKQAAMDQAGELPHGERRQTDRSVSITVEHLDDVLIKNLQNENAKLKEQLAAARGDALEEAAKLCESVLDTSRPITTSAYARFHAHAIRALASQPAAPVQPSEKVHQYRKQHCSDWYDGYPDESDGGGPYEVRTLYRAAPPVQQPGDVRDLPGNQAVFAIDILGNPMREYAPGKWENCAWPSDAALTVGEAVNMGDFMTFYDHTPERMIPATLGGWVDSVDLERAINSRDKTIDELRQALATTRPSAALTDNQIDDIWVDTDRAWRKNPSSGQHHRQYAHAILAAASGAVAVPEGWQPISTAPEDRMIDILMPDSTRWAGVYHDRICNEWRRITETGHMLRVPRDYPTHWHAIPAAPAIPGGAE